jgi:hypothetical protein
VISVTFDTQRSLEAGQALYSVPVAAQLIRAHGPLVGTVLRLVGLCLRNWFEAIS